MENPQAKKEGRFRPCRDLLQKPKRRTLYHEKLRRAHSAHVAALSNRTSTNKGSRGCFSRKTTPSIRPLHKPRVSEGSSSVTHTDLFPHLPLLYFCTISTNHLKSGHFSLYLLHVYLFPSLKETASTFFMHFSSWLFVLLKQSIFPLLLKIITLYRHFYMDTVHSRFPQLH